MSDSLKGIGGYFNSSLPKINGFKSALSDLKTDTLNNVQSALQGMSTTMRAALSDMLGE
jgi:hypothetical protein